MRFSAGISTPNSLGINYVNSPPTLHCYPCRCLWRGFLQITRTTFFRFTILHASQSLLTDGRTFITDGFGETKNAEMAPRLSLLAVGDPPLRQIVGGNL